MLDTFGEIELIVIKEHNARSKVPFPIELADGPVELASIPVELTESVGGVLLQGTVNWNASFTIPPSSELGEKGFAEATFQILRDEQIIYQVTQTLRQKSFRAASEPQTNSTFKIASLLHLDNVSPSDFSREITYTLRVVDVTLFSQSGVFIGDLTVVSAAVGAVTFLASEVAVSGQSESFYAGCRAESGGVKRVYADESAAPLPATIPFPTQILQDETMDLACIKVEEKYTKDGILLLAVINWGLRVTSETGLASLGSSGLGNATFEILRDDIVIYRANHTAVQPFIINQLEPVEAATFAITSISYFDTSPKNEKPVDFTYVLRLASLALINPAVTGGAPVTVTASVGPVTMVAEKVEPDPLRNKTKRRRR